LLNALGERFLIGDTKSHYFCGAVVVNKEERGSAGYAEMFPNRTVFIIDVGKSLSAGAGNKISQLTKRGLASDTNECNLVTKLFFDRRDRGAFCSARASPGSPKPEHHISVGISRQVDRFPRDGLEFTIPDTGRLTTFAFTSGLVRGSFGGLARNLITRCGLAVVIGCTPRSHNHGAHKQG